MYESWCRLYERTHETFEAYCRERWGWSRQRGWSQLRLAEEARARQATISGLETGKIQRIELPMLERIAKAVGVAPGELFDQKRSTRRRR